MKKEIEVKFRVKSLGSVRSRLKRMGAQLIQKGQEENIYFDTPLGVLKKRRTVLRLRRHGDEYLLSLKVKRKKNGNSAAARYGKRRFKEVAEFNVRIENFTEARALFCAAGYMEEFRYRKFREHWKIGVSWVELDTLADGRRFVEIEASRHAIVRIAKQLQLDWKDATTASYPELLGR